MFMKPTLAILAACVFVLLSNSLTAQDTQHQLGVNATAFTKQFLNLGNNDNITDSPYYVTYKWVPGKYALRAGIGGDYAKTESEDEFAGDLTSVTTVATLRIGGERQIALTDRWLTSRY